MGASDSSPTAKGNHLSCSMTAALVTRVRAFGGDEALETVLELAGSERTPEYLCEISNWISYDESLALLRAASQVTHHPDFGRALGEDAARRLNASPVAALLRSLGSPENVYRQIATTAGKFSALSLMEAVDIGPGLAEIVHVPVEGFPRTPEHCAWTRGLLTQPTVLFGLPPAHVEHEECAAYGAKNCRYRITWDVDSHPGGNDSSETAGALREQLEAMRDRLRSVFATASDLIDAGDIDDVLARIADRAAVEVRAPRYLLAVRTEPDGPMRCHQKGFEDEAEAHETAERILDVHPASLPGSWLVVPVRSKRRDYGRLLAAYEREQAFFPQERELIEVYARYAASALDGATALMEAKRRYDQSSALLQLARTLAAAGTSGEVARRLADAVLTVVDCDRVGVYLWDTGRRQLVTAATSHNPVGPKPVEPTETQYTPRPGGVADRLLESPGTDPVFIDFDSADEHQRGLLSSVGARSAIAVPLASPDSLLGLLVVSVGQQPERLKPNPDLLDRLSGVAAQATIALQNGRLLDRMTHHALHDQLTGLPNRLQFAEKLRASVSQAAQREQTVTLFYVDLDGFKPVNDELGHEAGDALLVCVGERLRARTRANDTVARLGGDEFAVLIDGETPPDRIEAVAKRLVGAFSAPFSVQGKKLTLGASIGRAMFPTDAPDADGLMRLADSAMFEAKRSGRGPAALRAL